MKGANINGRKNTIECRQLRRTNRIINLARASKIEEVAKIN